MIEEQNKNRLLIKFNNFVAVNRLYKTFDNLILESQVEKLTYLLANDFKGIIALFGNEVENQEKYIIGLIYFSKLIERNGSGFDLDLIIKWNHFNDEQKNNLLNLITCKKSITSSGSFDNSQFFFL
jgi:hypothetical protein